MSTIIKRSKKIKSTGKQHEQTRKTAKNSSIKKVCKGKKKKRSCVPYAKVGLKRERTSSFDRKGSIGISISTSCNK